MERKTIGEALASRENALNFVRLILAIAVIIAHTEPVGGLRPPTAALGGSLGGWAVNGFFVISGYLIAGSRVRLTVRPFVRRRLLRIMPAF